MRPGMTEKAQDQRTRTLSASSKNRGQFGRQQKTASTEVSLRLNGTVRFTTPAPACFEIPMDTQRHLVRGYQYYPDQ